MSRTSLIGNKNALNNIGDDEFMKEYVDIVKTKVFEREARYVVLKMTDILQHLDDTQTLQLCNIAETIRRGRGACNKQNLECVVVEGDWKIYDDVWRMIENMELYK